MKVMLATPSILTRPTLSKPPFYLFCNDSLGEGREPMSSLLRKQNPIRLEKKVRENRKSSLGFGRHVKKTSLILLE
ncbi:hypothetical protein CR513_22738, partial [Mucuna pruriens]